MKRINFFLLAFFFVAASMYAQDIEWEQLNGPFGGTALSFASNSNGDLFAGADQNQRGVFKSTDAGITWLPKSSGIALASRAINWITIDDSSYVIAGTTSHIGNGVYKSKDNGESWSQISILGGTSVAVNDIGHIYVGNTGSGQYSVSINAGYTWTHYTHPSPFINCIEINDSGHIFIGGNYTGYRSTDNGATWTSLSLPDGINSFAFAANGYIYAGCFREYAANSGVYKSTDNGDSWTAVKEGFRVYPAHNIVINENEEIFVGTWGWGVWKSTDNGDTWTQHNNGLGHLYIKSMHISNDGNVYAGLSGGGIYRSDNGGESWQQVGLTAAGVKKVAINPLNGYLFAAVNGVSRSSDGGLIWQPANNGLTNFDVKTFAFKTDGTIFLGAPGGGYAPPPPVFRTIDNGNTWARADNGIQNQTVEAITVDAAGNVYAGNYYGVYKSTDNGDSWVNIGGVGGAKVLAFNSLGDLFLASWGGGLWKLPAGETTWVDLTALVNASWNWSMLIGSNDYIYVGSKRSTDNGITWEEISQPGNYPCYAENSVGHIFMGTRSYGTGIWRSIDFGESWESLNTGLPTLEIWSLAIDSDDYLYAGTDGYSMLKTSTSTVTSVDKLNSPANFQCLKQNYPNPFNTITYISWQLPINAHVILKVYDFTGRELKTLKNGQMTKGKHHIDFDATGLSSGIYFYQLQVDGRPETRKMIHLK
ncbi:MAG: T9SS type A sorting domain-containing protein [Lentimicrobium sp.]|nr:T9SS type A sorting domain-containing protein [Lentimicrobium sp.]